MSQAQYAKIAEERAAEAMAKTGGGGSSSSGGADGGSGGAASSRMSTKKRTSISIAQLPGAGKLERMKTSWQAHKQANLTAAAGGANSKLIQSDQDLLDDPGFVKNVCLLMQDPHICSTFAVFDQDGSGSISTNELKEVVTMLQLASDKGAHDQLKLVAFLVAIPTISMQGTLNFVVYGLNPAVRAEWSRARRG